ncbi:GGDEF domain-containing protein [Novosphingobium sp. G106]|uniref:GGDEF domain-containing protein n=1 Tax=Novosphingobium sp. G106 TaxID=2849500 RepID=UPI001C2CC6D4|nr:GGDEF domain-containing protein [Novosphingobium sp. G106]MBV1689236.1 GGDEF domain-containing protein [Novosphingobium sp. G106]
MPQQSQQETLEVDLIRSLFEALGPVIIMSAGFIAAGGLIVWETRDPILALLLVAGTIVSLVRLVVMIVSRPEALSANLLIDRARFLQRRFTYSYFGFASLLGMFGYRALQLPFPKIHMLTICMLVGYAAGVAANACLRPRIAIPSMLVAVVPALTAALAQPDLVYWTTSMLASAFLSGGVRSVRARHARAARSISRRLAFSTLARQDGLTALPNRLALREWFCERVTDAENPGTIAVHFLDLNGFKPVNDCFGHPMGDALLVAVSRRIVGLIRPTDTAARLGGDEFAVLQCDIASADEAALMAKRLVAAIAQPYRIDHQTIEISTSLGYVIAEHGAEDLECLLSLADEALYASKRAGKGVTRWDPGLIDMERAAA